QAAVLSGVVGQGVLFPKDETHFRCIHHAMSESSMPSWVHTFASACLSGRCYSPGTASYLADSQRLTGYLVYPEGLPVSLDPSSIPSYSFHGAHMECTTLLYGARPPRSASSTRHGGTVASLTPGRVEAGSWPGQVPGWCTTAW